MSAASAVWPASSNSPCLEEGFFNYSILRLVWKGSPHFPRAGVPQDQSAAASAGYGGVRFGACGRLHGPSGVGGVRGAGKGASAIVRACETEQGRCPRYTQGGPPSWPSRYSSRARWTTRLGGGIDADRDIFGGTGYLCAVMVV